MSTFDLTDTVLDAKGNPIPSEGNARFLRTPQKVTVDATGETEEDVNCLIKNAEKLTYREAIQNALLADVSDQNQNMPGKQARSKLALKLVADTDVNFTSKEITTILNSAEHAPQVQTVVYMRLLEKLDPVEAGVKDEGAEAEEE